jgi:hypothetical protein
MNNFSDFSFLSPPKTHGLKSQHQKSRSHARRRKPHTGSGRVAPPLSDGASASAAAFPTIFQTHKMETRTPNKLLIKRAAEILSFLDNSLKYCFK